MQQGAQLIFIHLWAPYYVQSAIFCFKLLYSHLWTCYLPIFSLNAACRTVQHPIHQVPYRNECINAEAGNWNCNEGTKLGSGMLRYGCQNVDAGEWTSLLFNFYWVAGIVRLNILVCRVQIVNSSTLAHLQLHPHTIIPPPFDAHGVYCTSTYIWELFLGLLYCR